MAIVEAVSDYIAKQKVKAKIDKLERCQKDLCDDRGDIGDINRNIESLISDVESFIGANASSGIADKLRAMKEKNQCSDSDLNEAMKAIKSEINYLKQGLESSDCTCK